MSNEFAVGARGEDGIVILGLKAQPLTREQALNLAVWLTLVAGYRLKDFVRALESEES